MGFKILISDNLDSVGLEILQHEPQFTIVAGSFARDVALAEAADADALIVRSATKVDADFIAAAPRLKVVARAGAGVDTIDVPAATARGIVVMNTPGGNTIAAAEHAFGLMLALVRHIPAGHQSMLEGRWDRKSFMGNELCGKTLGLVGVGRIGKAMARRAQAFEMTTIGFDPVATAESLRECGVEPVSLDELYARSDIISLHAPANETSKGMINAASLAKMKTGVRIINAARGSLIDSEALAEAIRGGKVAGAALDVYPTEPPAEGFPLVGLKGVIHTPHLGASTVEAQLTVARQAAELVRDALLNHKYDNVVNPSAIPAG